MVNEIKNINDLVLNLTVISTKPLLNDETWKCFGYEKRPQHGAMWNKISPKIFELENYIQKELMIMGLIDVFSAIKKTKENHDTKLLIMIGVVSEFLSVTQHMFPPDSFMEDLFFTYTEYIKSEKSKIQELIILKAKNILDKKDFAKFMIGIICLIGTNENGGFLLNSDYIKDIIEKSSKEGKLDIHISNEIYKKYLPLIEEKILNI